MNSINYHKVILLDLDGTILNTEVQYMQIMLKYNKKFGEKFSKFFYTKNCVGKTKNEITQILHKKWGNNYDDAAYWNGLLKFRDEYFRKHGVQVKTGFYDLMQYLKVNKWGIAIVTSNSYLQTKKLLNYAKIDKEQFDYIITRDDVKNVKPANDLYLLAKQKFDNKYSKSTYVVEDSDVGLMSAQNLGIRTIYIKDICRINKLVRMKCYATVKSLKDVIDVLERSE